MFAVAVVCIKFPVDALHKDIACAYHLKGLFRPEHQTRNRMVPIFLRVPIAVLTRRKRTYIIIRVGIGFIIHSVVNTDDSCLK